MEKEGYKQVLVPEAFYNRLLARIEEAKDRPDTGAKPKKDLGEWCLTIVIASPDGEQHIVCLGNCAWYKQLFGGDCVSRRGGGCSCSWGILEPILGLFRR